MATRDFQYKYFPSQERLVNVSDYIINPSRASPSTDSVHRGRRIRDQTGDGLRASGDFDLRNVQWSETIFSAGDLLDLQLPVIVKAENGCHGDEELSLSAGQILQVSSSCEQTRITAVDGDSRILSLPLNYPLRGKIVSGSEQPDVVRSLSEIAQDVQLPVLIEVTEVKDSRGFSPTGASHVRDSRLTLREISRQKFLLCNAIVKGWLDQTKLVLISERLKMKFRLAIGSRNTTNAEWSDLCGMYSRSARHLQFDLIDGYEGVVYDDWVDPVENMDHLDHVAADQTPVDDSAATRHSSRIPEDYGCESDSDTMTTRNRSRLLRQQTQLSQGSLPSLPTAVCQSAVSASGTLVEPVPSGSATPIHLSNESLQPCRSTESLLPRASADSCVTSNHSSETSAKRKSNVPSRLRRRKGEARKQGVSTVEQLEQFDLASVGSGSSNRNSSSPSVEHVTLHPGNVKTRKTTSCSLTFDGNVKRDAETTSSTTSSDDNHAHKILRGIVPRDSNSKPLINDRPRTRAKSSDSHMVSPLYWSSDLCIETRIQSKGTSETTDINCRRASLHTSSISNVTPGIRSTDYPQLSLNQQPKSRVNSSGFVDYDSSQLIPLSKDQGLWTYQVTDVRDAQQPPTRHMSETWDRRVNPVTPETWAGHVKWPSYDFSHGNRSSSTKLGCYASSSSNTSMLDLATPLRFPSNRNRKQTNGSVKMRLDLNGTTTSTGSDAKDDGYGTKCSSMTSSLDTWTQKRLTNADRKNAFYI